MTRPEELVADARLCSLAHALGGVGVPEQPADALTERAKVAGVDQIARAPVLDLVADAPDPGGDHRAPLPHRLRDGEAEALRQALLRDDV